MREFYHKPFVEKRRFLQNTRKNIYILQGFAIYQSTTDS